MVKCSNCHCEIDENKIILHERFCSQNITYCEICKEGIVKEEYEEHCLEHNDKNLEISKTKSEEERNSLSLKRVESSKIGCQYCGFLLGFKEIEEHEEMCGAKTTKCNVCGKSLLFRDLENHISKEHGLKKDSYEIYSSFSKSDSNSSDDYGKKNDYNSLNLLDDEDLINMTTEEQIAYAIKLSEQMANEKIKKDKQKKNK